MSKDLWVFCSHTEAPRSWPLRTRLGIGGSGAHVDKLLPISLHEWESPKVKSECLALYQDFCIPNLRLLPSAGVSVSNFGFKYAGCPCGPFLFFKGVWPWPHQITEHEFLEAHSDDLQHKTSNALLCMSTRKFLRQVLQSITAAGHKGHCLEDQHKRYVFIPSHREPFSWLWWLKITRSSTDYRAVLSLWNPLAHIRTHSQCTKLSLAISWQGQKCTDKQQVQT